MNYMRRGFAFFLVALLVLALPSDVVNASSNIIHESRTVQTITSGATLENIQRFTPDGWLNICVLRVDLSNPHVKVDTLTSEESIKKLATTKALVESRGAVAAINGGFFNWLKEAGSAYPDGPIVESGKIVSASSEFNRYNDSMGAIAINQLNQVLYNFWKTEMKLVAPSGDSARIVQYNKPSVPDYTDFTIFDRRWSPTSLGVSQAYPDLVEMVVAHGKVVEIRNALPATNIPPNGYVVVTRKAGGKFLTDHFKIGDPVAFNITTTPNWKNVNMAVTGSAILVKDGAIPSKFSYDPSPGEHPPRTAIGSPKDGKQLIMVTVDGRQRQSIGMTLTQLAGLMMELGAYNALNLDGGGSTTMAARVPGTETIDIANRPSEGVPRAIATAIGVFSLAPPSELEGLIIDTVDENVFVNTSRSYTVKGYDKYFNPIEVDPKDVHWSASGIEGKFIGNTFYPSSAGEGKVKATVGNVSGEYHISSLSSPVRIELSKNSLKLPLGQTARFDVTGKNQYGYGAKINTKDIIWTVHGNIGTFDGNKFTATAAGIGYIDASVGDTHAHCAVSVAQDTSTIIDSFEKANGTFTCYPKDLGGSYKISSNMPRSGSNSGKLTYDFTKTEGTRAAYVEFPGEGLPLPANTIKIGLWVYNPHENSNWVRAEVYDTKGNKHLVTFTKAMDWTGWKYVEAPLNEISSPSRITKVYLAQISPVSVSDTVYLDDLTAVTSKYKEIDWTQIPMDTVPKDSAKQSVPYQKSDTSFRFSVLGQSHEPKNLLEKLLLTQYKEKTNAMDAFAIVGGGTHEIAKSFQTPVVSTGKGYQSFTVKNSTFLQLDMSQGGLRKSDPKQWHWFLSQLNTCKSSHLFIFLQDSPYTFEDSDEGALFRETLTEYRKKTGKTIWVFYKGASNTSYMERGIKYITTAGYDIKKMTPSTPDLMKHIIVTVNGDTVTYEFKSIV